MFENLELFTGLKFRGRNRIKNLISKTKHML